VLQTTQPINRFLSRDRPFITSLGGSSAEVTYEGVTTRHLERRNTGREPRDQRHLPHFGRKHRQPRESLIRSPGRSRLTGTSRKITVTVFNEAGEQVRLLVNYVDDPGGQPIDGMTLSSSVLVPGQSSSGLPSVVSVSTDQGTVLGTWDGRSDAGTLVSSGQYFIEIHSEDGISGSTTITKRVTVMESGPNWEKGMVQARPNRLTSANPQVTFYAEDSDPLTLRVRLYDMAGEKVGDGTPGPLGTNTATWDCTNYASGLYIAVVELYGSNGLFSGRQHMKLLVVH
jgi:hypothetical protein